MRGGWNARLALLLEDEHRSVAVGTALVGGAVEFAIHCDQTGEVILAIRAILLAAKGVEHRLGAGAGSGIRNQAPVLHPEQGLTLRTRRLRGGRGAVVQVRLPFACFDKLSMRRFVFAISGRASKTPLILSLPAYARASAGLLRVLVRQSLGEGGSKDVQRLCR